MIGSSNQIERRLYSLERHLKQENPVLLRIVQTFRDLDWVAYRMGLLSEEESFATRVPWWPLIAILGTFSSGKSTFINSLLDQKLQRTGNQAVDDKFTVICYSNEGKAHTLPGIALDADPRFPFYQMSQQIESVVEGEGRRIDAYLQLKTSPSENLRGKIIIDSPGFDADAQRTSTLRITDHIMNLSDLVLVFFDARHPEPGAMRDTLDHLVANTINRPDSNKFLFILNQIDCTARDDNLEDVVAAWQRALAQSGLTAGRFYQIYNEDAANPMEDASVRTRYQVKRNEDMSDIMLRLQRVEVERAYRIIGVLEHTARNIQDRVVPKLEELIQRWRKAVLIGDAILLGTVGAIAATVTMGFGFTWPWPVVEGLLESNFEAISSGHIISFVAILIALWGLGTVHYGIRRLVSRWMGSRLDKEIKEEDSLELISRGFAANTSRWRFLLQKVPMGWNGRSQRRVATVLRDTDTFVQDLNDQFTNPSGKVNSRNPKITLDVE
ncbi:MAG: dynamin family protein [Magnetococcales bacterium]|nr:dynamin family protein [Magnetococcales bacterium]NGZ26520.1 dynamin family protein [Magnetococcales bacterium]